MKEKVYNSEMQTQHRSLYRSCSQTQNTRLPTVSLIYLQARWNEDSLANNFIKQKQANEALGSLPTSIWLVHKKKLNST